MKLRAWKVVNNKLYVIVNDKFCVINPDWSWSTIARINTSYGNAWMDFNQFHICITDGYYGYTFDMDSTFSEISNFTGGKGMTFLDGFLLSGGAGSAGQEYFCFASSVFDATSWNGLAFGSVESSPDRLVLPVALKDAAIMYGESSIEVWSYTGDGTMFPFAFLPGTAINYGLAAVNSVANLASSKAALLRSGNQFLVGYIEGYTVVSLMKNQPEVEAEWSRYSRVDDAIACSYFIDGFNIYQITFPTERKTWAYESNSGVWVRMETDSDMFIGLKAIEWNGAVIFADNDANLYYFDTQSDMDDDYPVSSKLVSNRIRGYTKRVIVDRLTLDMSAGEVGIPNDDYQPSITVSMSPDGGNTFFPSHTCPIGGQGEYQKRVITRRFGAGKDIVMSVSWSGVDSPARYTIMGHAELEINA